MSLDQGGISLQVPCFGACPGKESSSGGAGDTTTTNSSSSGGGGWGGGVNNAAAGAGAGLPAAGTYWQDSAMSSGMYSPTAVTCPMEVGGLLSTGKSSSKSRPVTVAYVVNGETSQQNNNAESLALQCLKDACDAVGSKLETVNFGKLDFGETTVLDSFYNAGESKKKVRKTCLPKLTKLIKFYENQLCKSTNSHCL